MRILVVDFAAKEKGAITTLKNFYEEAKADKGNEYIFLLCDNFLKPAKNIQIIKLQNSTSKIFRLKFDFFIGKKIVKTYRPDAIFSLQNTIIFGTRVRQILYIQQSLPFQKAMHFSFFKKTERKLAVVQHLIGPLIIKSAKRAHAVIVQSHWLKEAVSIRCHINPKKIFVIPPTTKIQTQSKHAPSFNRFFYPTSNFKYKNNELLLLADQQLQKEGFSGYRIEITISGESSTTVSFLGAIPYDEVMEKLSSSILVFPSKIESFGLPLLEAREQGTIIFASDLPFAHEILAGYENAYYFNPDDVSTLLALIRSSLNEKIIYKKPKSAIGQKQLKITDIIKGAV